MSKPKEYDIYTADYIKGVVPHHERFVKLSVAEALEKRINGLECALRLIADKYYCQCEPAHPDEGEGPYLCNKCIARRALEGKRA